MECVKELRPPPSGGFCQHWGVGRRANIRRKFTLSLPLVYHLKMDVSSIFDHKNKESTKCSYPMQYLE